YTRDPSPLTEYYIAYYAAALLGLIQHWLERGMPEDSHTMARIMLSIMFLKPGDPIKLQGEKR
ncbi:MAG: TetR family transcriptional regulator C-terminal domain-containing protein, partial [Coriobacteriia bacterium]|nr:TetR family transcriptional regulator C-terminal domain-containing protein [Coriobacteriia bacterium]